MLTIHQTQMNKTTLYYLFNVTSVNPQTEMDQNKLH